MAVMAGTSDGRLSRISGVMPSALRRLCSGTSQINSGFVRTVGLPRRRRPAEAYLALQSGRQLELRIGQLEPYPEGPRRRIHHPVDHLDRRTVRAADRILRIN